MLKMFPIHIAERQQALNYVRDLWAANHFQSQNQTGGGVNLQITVMFSVFILMSLSKQMKA